VSQNNHLNAHSLKQLKDFLSRVKNPDFICSSYLEFAPWYRYNYGFIVLCWICGIKITPKDIWRVLKSSLYNLVLKSKISHSYATKVFSSDSIIFTWIIGPGETRQDCLGRYFVSLADEKYRDSHVWALCTFTPDKDACARLNAEGVTLIWTNRPQLRDIVKAISKVLRGLNPLLCLDAEFWKGEQIADLFLNWTAIRCIKPTKIVLPYEQQPWQLRLIYRISQDNAKTFKIIGDAHTSLTNIPSQFIKTIYSPDLLIVHGHDYKTCLVERLGWEKEDVFTLPSNRLRTKISIDGNWIVLPYTITSAAEIAGSIHSLKTICEPSGKWSLKPHPARHNDADYQSKLAIILREVDTLNQSAKKTTGPHFALVVGVSTYILEALESGIEVYHFVEHPETESYPPDIWKCLERENITNNLFRYRLLKQGGYVIYD
jgi:hypothetical protein